MMLVTYRIMDGVGTSNGPRTVGLYGDVRGLGRLGAVELYLLAGSLSQASELVQPAIACRLQLYRLLAPDASGIRVAQPSWPSPMALCQTNGPSNSARP